MKQTILNEITFDNDCLNYINMYFQGRIEEGTLYCITNSMYKLYNKNMYKVGKSINDKMESTSFRRR